MSERLLGSKITKRRGAKVVVASKGGKVKRFSKFSPAWVVAHSKEAPGYNLELINRIRVGVKKSDWKDLIVKIGHTEKDLEHVLPASISSMQKKTVYGKETSERIYELAKLYSLGYEVFDSEESFKQWLMSPSKALGGKKPFELLDSSFGFQLVENEIVRIQYNVYS
jgi:putative toxin-antitoxin system antitoxin component (TIGR02293 family)